MKYRVVFIDWDGTLSISRFWERWQKSDRYELIQHYLFSVSGNNQLIDNWMSGKINHVGIVNHISSATRIPAEELLTELKYSAERMKFVDEAIPKKIKALRDNGTKVIVATNNMDTFRLWTIPAMKLENTFDGFLVSDSLRCMKQDVKDDGTSKFFGDYLNLHNLSPSDAVLIDDSADIKSERFGIDFLQITSTDTLVKHLDSLLATNFIS